jgi:hypothetical protein
MVLVSWSGLRTPASLALKAAAAVAALIVCLEIIMLVIWAAALFVDGPSFD